MGEMNESYAPESMNAGDGAHLLALAHSVAWNFSEEQPICICVRARYSVTGTGEDGFHALRPGVQAVFETGLTGSVCGRRPFAANDVRGFAFARPARAAVRPCRPCNRVASESAVYLGRTGFVRLIRRNGKVGM